MKTYLVGGAVRDQLLDIPVHEHDWVVVGSSPAEMLELGYQQVGKDFPVFLHPESHDEYALARMERKTAAGYHGFEFDTASTVTLEEDLLRRDLTINAMALDDDGNIVDPYGGQADIEAKLLRHVSPAFAEDPVRILRIARFHARLAPRGFTIAPETLELMRAMVDNGEVDALVPERVWAELIKALNAVAPQAFIESLRDCGALARILPEVDNLFGVPQRADYHPEVDTGVHTLMALEMATRLSNSTRVRFAALVHDLGKADTPADILPSHRGHEELGVGRVDELCERLKAPREFRDLGRLTSRWHLHVHRAFEITHKTILKLMESFDVFRRPERFDEFLTACESDARGRLGLYEQAYPQADYLREIAAAVREINAREFAEQGLQGMAIQDALRKKRLHAIRALQREKPSTS